MPAVHHGKPSFSPEEASLLADRLYNLPASASALPSERDQNFLLETASGDRYVLKIASAEETPSNLELQIAAMTCLREALGASVCPQPLPTADGESIASAKAGDKTHLVRLMSFMPGEPLARFTPHTSVLRERLGALLADVDRELARLESPSPPPTIDWNLLNAEQVLARCTPDVKEKGRRKLLDHFTARLAADVQPKLSKMRRGLIHNDANDYNVLVHVSSPDAQPTLALLDFGDMQVAPLMSEAAVAAAYALLDKPCPLAAAADVVRGYHGVHPLLEGEIELLYDLIALRLCVSVALAARQKQLAPENDYLTISEGPAWAALERWRDVHPQFAHAAFRSACGLEPDPRSAKIARWLQEHAAEAAPILGPDMNRATLQVFDLSVGSWALDRRAVEDMAAAEQRLEDARVQAGAAYGVGSYAERRAWCSRAAFQVETNDGPAWRSLHLGIDLFAPPGTAVYAPLTGVVEQITDDETPFGGGPTVILEHSVDEGRLTFYTSYRHLSRASLGALRRGDAIGHGEPIGEIGARDENGGWPPHVHVQIFTDLFERKDAFPGVVNPEQAPLWMSLCPDPNLLLGLQQVVPAPEPARGALLERRRRHISGALSLAYRAPLEIQRGAGVYLYDEQGQAYLDCVNNVCHVGHAHPHVVAAGSAQMGVLNTNTRYLHPLRGRYIERLLATLPEPLRVVFFVNSGSEANDLALRLARAHTRAAHILVVEGAYHGHLSSLIEISPYKFDGPGGEGAPNNVHKTATPDPYRGPYRRKDAHAGERYADGVRAALARIGQSGERPAAFIVEPLMGVAGQIVPPAGYLPAAFAAVREAGAVCIADEVQIGLGRVGSAFWGFELQGAVPDIVTMGKPLGNGHPLAAVVTTPEIAASFETGMEYFNTFGGNPVSCAIGLAVLEVIEKEGLQANARRVGAYLKDGLERLQARFPLIGDVRGEGLFLGVELVRDHKTLEPADQEAYYIIERLKELGVLVSVDGLLHNVLKIKPPIVFTQANADRLLEALESVLSESVLQGE